MIIQELYARLAHDTSTMQSLFTGKFGGLQQIKMTLSTLATGTAHFAIYENGLQKVAQNVTHGGSISYSPQAGSTIEFFINSYDGTDLPTAEVMLS